LEMHSKSAPKYGSEKSGAPTNYYITLSPQPVKITNAELEDVEVVIAPDHKAFSHTNPLLGLVAGGTFILQSSASAEQVWQELPAQARKTIREKKINFFIIDAFAVAKKHAPTPELATRMMGIAFIGAVAGHVNQVSKGAAPEVILAKIRQQISKKFGGKGGAVIDGNMAVIGEGIEATQKVDYALDTFIRIDAKPAPIAIHDVSLSASICQSAGSSGCAGMFDRGYYDDMVLTPFRQGAIGEAPVLPGTGLFMPAGTASAKDKGLFRRSVPEFKADLCTGCMECALVCPDGAIPNSVHEIHDLLLTGIDQLALPPSQRELMRSHVYALASSVREAYRQSKQERPMHELVAEAATQLETDNVTVLRNFSRLIDALALYPVARTRPFFDAMEKVKPGSGALYSVSIDPWKCTGCLECVEVCGPAALVKREQDAALLQSLQQRFDFMSKTPNPPARFVADAIDSGGEIKRLLLDRANYYSTTGGHGACRGCGEVTATRLVMATSHALGKKRQHQHSHELETLIGQLRDKQATLIGHDSKRQQRLGALIGTLERRLYLYESGPTGNGPAGTVVANSTGCSSVYASTFPFNAFKDPWVNSLFQDAQPLAKGIFEGIAAQTVGDVQALRLARLELADAYDPATHDPALRILSWQQFSVAELSLLPTVITVGGDGATYDIGFGALSRILMSGTPLKVLVLNTGSYSNTGGQASTSSFLGQDADLARFGNSATGKHESRKELALIAAFHSNVFVCATSTALQGHFLKNTLEALNYTDGPAVLDVYTPCQGEQGISDAASNQRSRLAVEARMNPVFVHDPRRGNTLHDWFSLEGNPQPLQTWASTTLEYLDDAGQLKLLNMALTPAHFALGEVRFKKQFHLLGADDSQALPVEAFVELTRSERAGKAAFIWSTDGNQHLVKIAVTQAIVALVEERRKYWHLLQFLAGQQVAKMDENHRTGMAALQAQYRDSVTQRDNSLDSFARAMSELAAASKAPVGSARVIPIMAQTASTGSAAASPDGAATAPALVSYDIADQVKCTDCKTCYQDLPELFEKTRIVVNGESRDVGQLIAGAMERVKVTPELRARIKRVAANCDAEIIS
ncbi:MAG: 2-oxoacid:acceptor oxidoreductase family protein, partial [Rhodoferax sp.]|nr:2-oxoacid:acceptor oxidoreductase family protein [Rhodoferax sp.]